MQSSIALAGVQWNMPVESYFISVFSKSKSLAWSSAMPTSKPLPPPFAFSTLALFVGLKQKCRGARVQRTIRWVYWKLKNIFSGVGNILWRNIYRLTIFSVKPLDYCTFFKKKQHRAHPEKCWEMLLTWAFWLRRPGDIHRRRLRLDYRPWACECVCVLSVVNPINVNHVVILKLSISNGQYGSP